MNKEGCIKLVFVCPYYALFHTNKPCKVGRLFTAVSIFVVLDGSARPPRLIEQVLI